MPRSRVETQNDFFHFRENAEFCEIPKFSLRRKSTLPLFVFSEIFQILAETPIFMKLSADLLLSQKYFRKTFREINIFAERKFSHESAISVIKIFLSSKYFHTKGPYVSHVVDMFCLFCNKLIVSQHHNFAKIFAKILEFFLRITSYTQPKVTNNSKIVFIIYKLFITKCRYELANL